MAAPNPRASLLSGLRTGGVRSASASPPNSLPHSAAPGASFNLTVTPSPELPNDTLPHVSDMPSSMHFSPATVERHIPNTAAVDGHNGLFAHQQTANGRGMNPYCAPFSPAFYQSPLPSPQLQLQAQALQMQMMQLEILRLQVSLFDHFLLFRSHLNNTHFRPSSNRQSFTLRPNDSKTRSGP
jgi:hypothetical protein